MRINRLKIVCALMVGMVIALSAADTARGQTADVIAESNRAKANVKKPLNGKLRIPKAFGVVPMGPGHKEAAPLPCGQFYVAALDPKNGNKPVAYTGAYEQGRDDGEFYTCNYSMELPINRTYYVVVGMGGALLLPKQSREPVYITDAWIGGTNNKPRRGYERGFAGKYINFGSRSMYLAFEMTYAQVDPN